MKIRLFSSGIISCLFTFVLVNAQIPEGEYALSASSTLSPSKTANFSPDNLMDGTTASWSEGVDGNGVGEKIFLDLKYPDKLERISIKNGYGIAKYWKANARISYLKVSDASGESRLLHLEDTPDLRTYGLIEMEEEEDDHYLYPGKPLTGQQFTFEIVGVYDGEQWDDACITEIFLNEWYSDNFLIDEQHIFKNLYREYFNGVMNGQGELFIESDWEGYVKIDVNNGAYHKDLNSGDGTQGFEKYQIFINGMTKDFYLLKSTYLSEVTDAGMEGKVGKNGKPEMVENYNWEFKKYNKEQHDFSLLGQEDLEELFLSPPALEMSLLSGKELTNQGIWIRPGEEPGRIEVAYPSTLAGSDYELYYSWDGNWFRKL